MRGHGTVMPGAAAGASTKGRLARRPHPSGLVLHRWRLKGYSAILVPLAVHMNDAAFHGGADVSDRRAVTLGPVGATPRPATASIAADRIDVDTSALLAFFDDLCSATSRPRTSICARRAGKGTDPLQVAASNSDNDACLLRITDRRRRCPQAAGDLSRAGIASGSACRP